MLVYKSKDDPGSSRKGIKAENSAKSLGENDGTKMNKEEKQKKKKKPNQ
jgi:hypothetical protein